MTLATQVRKPVKIANKTYYYTQPDVHTYKFEFEDGRAIGQISYIRGTGREKDYWIPGTTGVHAAFWAEACALLLQEYWEQQAAQATQPAPAPPPFEPEPPVPAAVQEEWVTIKEAAARLQQWGEQSVGVRVRAGFFTARKQYTANDGKSSYRWELLWPGLDAARVIMRRPVPPEILGPAAVARQQQASTNGHHEAAPSTNGYHAEPLPVAVKPEPAPADAPASAQTLVLALMQQIEQLHAARVEDTRTIGRLTMQVEILEARLAAAEAPKPAPRKWWQP